MIKKTLRRFILSVPTGKTEKMQVRYFVRATDGVEYPVDKEIEVEQFEAKTFEQVCYPGSTPSIDDVTEEWARAQFPGSTAISMEDIVTFEEG